MYIFCGEIAKLFAQTPLTLSPTTSERYVPKATSIKRTRSSTGLSSLESSFDSRTILPQFQPLSIEYF